MLGTLSMTRLTSFLDLLSYTCTYTPRVVVIVHAGQNGLHYVHLFSPPVERTRPSKKRKKATPTPSSTNDLHSLTYTLRNTRITTKIARKFNEQGFGAGGLPPLTFSHLPRNWCGSSHRDEDDGGGMGIGECGMGVRNGEGGMEWSYGPGMGLDAGEVDGEEGKEGGGEETSAPPHKRICVGPRPHTQRVGVVHIPSHQIQRYSGGRGFTRVRSKRALETARKLKKVKNANSRYSVLAKSAVLGNVTCNVFSVVNYGTLLYTTRY
jgi:hypothetical protein